MKTVLLLTDEPVRPMPPLPEAIRAEVPFRETEAVAGCNCDRWGHPSPGCANGDAGIKAERPFPLPLDE